MLKKYYSVYIKDFISIKYSNSLSHIPKMKVRKIKELNYIIKKYLEENILKETREQGLMSKKKLK